MGDNKEILLGKSAEKFISRYIDVPKSEFVKQFKDITMGSPVVLKIVSKDAIHKTEIGGVRFARSQSEIELEFKNLQNNAKKRNIKIEGILIQEIIKGVELIVGIKKDPTFNHVILVGMGGIYAEAIKDTSVRKCPITVRDAEEMISELRMHKLLEGERGIKTNRKSIIDALVSISKLPRENKSLKELDINPLIVNQEGSFAVDSRAVFE